MNWWWILSRDGTLKEEWNGYVKKSGALTEKSNFDVFTSRPQRAKERITEFKGRSIGEFHGGPVVRTLSSQSLVGELLIRSHKLHSAAKVKK